jgi:hypothetical protein
MWLDVDWLDYVNGSGSNRLIIRPLAKSLWLEICICRICHSTCKNYIKIISLISKI